MIIEYDSIYDEQIKDLLVELQNYLIDIDDWHTQILLPQYREEMFKIDKNKVDKQNGKIYLYVEKNVVKGLIIGIVEEKDEIDKLTNDCAKTGSILELVVKSSIRGQGIGKILLEKMEEYFKDGESDIPFELFDEETQQALRALIENYEKVYLYIN